MFVSYANDMMQAVNWDLFLYADNSCLVYQHNDVSNIDQNLNCFEYLRLVGRQYAERTLWRRQNKTHAFWYKTKTKKAGSLDIRYGTMQI